MFFCDKGLMMATVQGRSIFPFHSVDYAVSKSKLIGKGWIRKDTEWSGRILKQFGIEFCILLEEMLKIIKVYEILRYHSDIPKNSRLLACDAVSTGKPVADVSEHHIALVSRVNNFNKIFNLYQLFTSQHSITSEKTWITCLDSRFCGWESNSLCCLPDRTVWSGFCISWKPT
jgi:hypothetical protein